ncbi:MAG: DUF4350 domain-containing protein [Haliangium ochraceum]
MALKPPSAGKSTMTMAGPSWVWSAVFGLGMALLFSGERIMATGKPRLVLSVLGVVCLLGAMIARLVRSAKATPDRRAVERYIQSMYALGLLAVALYFVQSDVPALRGGKLLETTWPKLATALAAIWPAVWCAAMFAILPMELAYAPMARAPRVELGRVRAAQFSGLGLAFILTFAFSLAYAASERDKKVDLAYFRTTRPGESTRKIVRSLDQALTVALFFPNANEVREEVDGYFTDLGKESGQLKIEHYDYDIEPVKSKELGVSANGIVVFQRGGRKEQLGLQLQLENARAGLKSLDREVQQRLLSVVKPSRVTFITQGHGERTSEPTGDTDRRPGVRELRNALQDQGHDVRDLGPAEGLATDIPKDATLVMVLGPTKPFPPEEIGALQRFLDRGGRLFLALDPDGGVDMHEILDPMGLKLTMKTLANDQVYARRTHQDIDRTNLVTGLYSSHASVSTLSRQGMRSPTVFPGAAGIEPVGRDKGTAKDYAVDFTVHAHFATFEDSNGNFNQDPGESRKAWELAAAASKKVAVAKDAQSGKTESQKDSKQDSKPEKADDKTEQRLFVVGDSDFLTDAAVRFGGNGLLVLDAARWLMGEESFAGQISTETDIPISHTRKQDVAWFYSSVFVVPGLVLGVGAVVTRRRRGQRRRPKDGASAPPSNPAATSATGQAGVAS